MRQTEDPVSPGPRREKPVVLCVDDDPKVLTAIQRTLRSEAYEVVTVSHAAGALEWLETLPVSLVIADEHMPGMTGTELFHEVRRRFPGTANVILTGFLGHRVMCRSQAAGVEALLFKPWDEEGLRQTVCRLLSLRAGGPGCAAQETPSPEGDPDPGDGGASPGPAGSASPGRPGE